MDRRKFLSSVGVASAIGLAGCSQQSTNTGTDTTTTKTTTKTDSNTPPEDVTGSYIPTHVDMMGMAGMAMSGRLRAMVSFTTPHRFWLTTGSRTNEVPVKEKDTMHLMVNIWDSETGVLPPGVEPTVTIYKDGEKQSTLNPWPMLSQPMGYHFGDNVQVSGDGDYRFEISVNNPSDVLPDDLDSVFTKQTLSVKKSFNPGSAASELNRKKIKNPFRAGAIPPMDMKMMDVNQQPKYSEFPISMAAPKTTDDMTVSVGEIENASDYGIFTEKESALVVAPQTKYNRYLIPLMGVSAAVSKDGEIVYEGDLSSAYHPEFGHFYGASTPELPDGATVELTFQPPSQSSRHLGYERAFLQLDDLSFTL